jgi:hemoglobin/transferrin/lactoferrin receptor protein
MKKNLLWAGLSVLSLGMQAQQGVPVLPDTLKAINLLQFQVSTTRFFENSQTQSQSSEHIPRQRIQSLQAQNTADLVGSLPEVFVQKSQMGGGSPVLRGFEASRLLLVVDGVRMNNLIYRAGHLQNILSIDNQILDRVEVLMGPSSTAYGTDALGGVIHMITRNPELAGSDAKRVLHANAGIRYGAVNNEQTLHADVSIGGKRWGSLSSFTHSRFGDLRGGTEVNPFYDTLYGMRPTYQKRIDGKDSVVSNSDPYLQIGSAYNQIDVLQKFVYQSGTRFRHLLNVQYSTSSDIPRFDRLSEPNGNAFNYGDWYYGPQNRLLAAYALNYSNPSGWFNSGKTTLSYQDVEESRVSRRFGKTGKTHRIESVQVYGVTSDWMHQGREHIVRMGLDIQYNTLKSSAYLENIETGALSTASTRYPDGGSSLGRGEVYVTHQWKWGEKLYLNDGLRLGYSQTQSAFSDTSFYKFAVREVVQKNPVWSASLGLNWNPIPRLRVIPNISTGYRVPNVDDLSKIFDSAPGDVIIPNAAIKPELTYNADVKWVFETAAQSFVDVTLWGTLLRDAVKTMPFTYQGQDSILYDGALSRVLANQNAGKAYLYGAVLKVRQRIWEGISISGGMQYTYGRVQTDSIEVPLDHIPPLTARFDLMVQRNAFQALFFAQWNGWKRIADYYLDGEDNEAYATPLGMPAWYTLNLHASYQWKKYIRLSAGCDNILDLQYRSFASGINAPGRNVFLRLDLMF